MTPRVQGQRDRMFGSSAKWPDLIIWFFGI